MPGIKRTKPQYRSLAARINARPRQMVYWCFSVVFVVTLILAGRQYFLGRDAQLNEREHRLQLQAIAVDTGIEGAKNQLRFLRDAAERILSDEQGNESAGLALQNAMTPSQKTVGAVSLLETDSPVRTIAKERIEAIPGYSQDQTRLNQDLKLAHAMKQVLAVQFKTSQHLEHVLFISTTGLIVSYPAIANEKLESVLQVFAASRFMQPHSGLLPDFNVTFRSLDDNQLFTGRRLQFSSPVVFHGVVRAGIVFDLAQQKLQEYMFDATPTDELHALLDSDGTLIASNQDTFTQSEGNWLETRANPMPELSMAALFRAKSGVVPTRDNFYLFRELPGSGLMLVNQITASALRWSVISQFSTVFIFIWLSLGVLLVMTLLIVDQLLSNQMSLNKKLRELGLVDTLTQLANRRRLQIDFKGMVRRFEGKHPIALLLIDIDKFKTINDNWGHSTGDEVIKHLAGVCRALVRPQDLIVRYGGEEFCVVLPATSLAQAKAVAEKLRTGIEQSVCLPDPILMLSTAPSREVRMTVSIGVAELGVDQASDLEQLVAKADRRLYAAKQNGRNRVVFDDGLLAG